MRPLSVLLFLSLLESAARAAPAQLDLSTQFTPVVNGFTRSTAIQFGMVSTLGVNELAVGEDVRLGFSHSISHLSGNQRAVLDARQVGKNLDQKFHHQTSGTGRWQRGPWTLSSGIDGTLGKSAYAQYGANLAAAYAFFERSTIIGSGIAVSKQSRPEDYFLGTDFRVHPRVRSVSTYDLYMEVEQSLSEAWKAKARTRAYERVEERPLALGAEVSTALALGSGFYSRIGGTYDFETRSQPLVDERGYFRNWSARFELGKALDYAWTAAVGFEPSWETEDEPRLGVERTLGTDTVGLTLERITAPWGVRGTLGLSRDSLQRQYFNGGVSISWLL